MEFRIYAARVGKRAEPPKGGTPNGGRGKMRPLLLYQLPLRVGPHIRPSATLSPADEERECLPGRFHLRFMVRGSFN